MAEKVVIGNAELWHGDALDVLPLLPPIGAMVSDPPYPNAAGLFLDGVPRARLLIGNPPTGHILAFWDEMDEPYCPLTMVARHAWHRTNTNRPDNYEAIYEWHSDGKKRASRIFPFAVVAVGLTGCTQATGHPTQKHERLMQTLVQRTQGTVFDPFMGSGSTGVACAIEGRPFVGVEIDRQWFDVACDRIEKAQAQGQMFAKVGAGDTAVQGDMLLPANAEFSGAAQIHRAASAGTPS